MIDQPTFELAQEGIAPTAGLSWLACLVSIRNLLINMVLVGRRSGRRFLVSPLFQPANGVEIAVLFVVAVGPFASAPFIAARG